MNVIEKCSWEVQATTLPGYNLVTRKKLENSNYVSAMTKWFQNN